MDKKMSRITLYLEKRIIQTLRKRAIDEDKDLNRYVVTASDKYEEAKQINK